MARLWNKDLLLSANTDAFNQRLNEMRYNAASENRKQWANAIGNVANSLGDIGKAAYEDYQRDQRYKSIDDADAEYKNDPVWIAAKNEYAKTGDSSKLNAVKTQFVAQKQAEANRAAVQEEKDKRLEGVKATLAGLKQQIEAPDIKTGDRLALITQYDTKAAEAGLPKYSKDQDPAEPKHLTDSGIENTISSSIDQNGDGKFDSADIQMLIDAVNNDKTRDEADRTNILAKLDAANKNLVKQEKDAVITDLKNKKETLSAEKPTDTSYANLANIRAWNAKVDEFNKSLGDNAAAVGTISKITEPKKPLPSASKQDVINWAKSSFVSRITKDPAFISNNWTDIVDTYNAKHQGKPYRGK